MRLSHLGSPNRTIRGSDDSKDDDRYSTRKWVGAKGDSELPESGSGLSDDELDRSEWIQGG